MLLIRYANLGAKCLPRRGSPILLFSEESKITCSWLHNAALLDLFLSSDAGICSTMAFPTLGYSHHVVVTASINFPIDSKQDVPFHRIAYNFKLSASAAASELCEWFVYIDVYIPHRKYQVKPHSSPWFSAACAASIVRRNHFFRVYRKDKSSVPKAKFRQASNRCKRVLEAAKLAYANKTKDSITSQKLGLLDFRPIANIILSNGKSTAQRYCLLHLIKQDCFLKTSLRILIMMIQISLYQFSLLELIWNCIIIL